MKPKNTGQIDFGAAYYYEYARVDERPSIKTLRDDMRLMLDAGITTIRIGESVWSTWEPEPGKFDLEWIAPVFDASADLGLKVILGTPTYAVPPWMAAMHPEINLVDENESSIGWGGRQEMDIANPTYRFYVERLIRKMVKRYLDAPNLVGYQVDNEPGKMLVHNPEVFSQFVQWLRKKYTNVENLNEEWGLTYWSHRLSDWSDLWTPKGNKSPQYALAWRQFQADLVTDFISWQADIVREIASPTHPERYVTTCIAYEQKGIADASLCKNLDVAAANIYYRAQDSLEYPDTSKTHALWINEGLWSIYHASDIAYSSKRQPFLVTETNAGSIGGSHHNLPPYDGQLRQVAWAMASRGANLIEYWHWGTLQYGTETFWGGILPHDGKPGRIYEEIAKIGKEFNTFGDDTAGMVPDADVAYLYSSDSKFALSSLALAPLNTGEYAPDEHSYRKMSVPFYRGAFDAGLQVDMLRPELLFDFDLTPAAFVKQRPVLVVPAFFVASDKQLLWLREYANAGGHLVLTPRSAYADQIGRVRGDQKPSLFSDLAGVHYQESQNLQSPVALTSKVLDSHGVLLEGTQWSDYLVPDDCDVLASYDHPHLGKWAAATTKAVGDGRVTVVGTIPNLGFGKALFEWISPKKKTWEDLPSTCRVTSSVNGKGKRVFFLHNWSWENVSVSVPEDLVPLSPEVSLDEQRRVALSPWDVQLFCQRS